MKPFITDTRADGSTFVYLADDAPEWLRDAVHAAHQGDLPNDWIFAECAAAFEDCEDQNHTHDHADRRVDIYTKDLAQWYADMCLSTTFAEAEARVGIGNTVNARLMAIQYNAIRYITEMIADAKAENKSTEDA